MAGPGSEINKSDIPPIADLLHDLTTEQDVDLLLQSPGGETDTAEKIVGMLRHRSRTLRVIVAESAKSAATLVAIASDVILMGYTSELGPIDPQVMVTLPNGQGELSARPFCSGWVRVHQGRRPRHRAALPRLSANAPVV